MTADLVQITTTIDASPEEIFPYLIEPERLIRWLGTWANVAPEPGGVFEIDMGETQLRGTFIEVDPPHRVVFTWGIPGNEEMPSGSSTVQIVLTPHGAATTLELTHRDLPVDRRSDHYEGWTSKLGELSAVASH